MRNAHLVCDLNGAHLTNSGGSNPNTYDELRIPSNSFKTRFVHQKTELQTHSFKYLLQICLKFEPTKWVRPTTTCNQTYAI